jgi:hypothetical protein
MEILLLNSDQQITYRHFNSANQDLKAASQHFLIANLQGRIAD